MLSDKALTFTLIAFCALMLFWVFSSKEQKEPDLESGDDPIIKGTILSGDTKIDRSLLMANLGVNAIRLPVLVHPADGWCNRADVVQKAMQARELDLDVMIDFHYSDWWANVDKQNKPKAWESLSLEELQEAVGKHTRDVLSDLRNHDVEPQWIQIGNETSDGMLWPTGRASESMTNYATLHQAGYTAAKSICPKALVMVHIDRGEEWPHLQWLLDGLRANGAQWDMVGVSLHPELETWQGVADACIYNLEQLVRKYDTPVIISEVGLSDESTEVLKKFTEYLLYKGKGMNTAVQKKVFHGLFYWKSQLKAVLI